MTDQKILELLSKRSQQGISEVRDKYGRMLLQLADNILGNRLDAEECVNDALFRAWDSPLPQRPESLLPWLCSTVRNIAMNRFRTNSALKRGGGGFDLSLDELGGIADLQSAPDSFLDLAELTQVLNRFLRRLSPRDRALLMGRYYAGEAYSHMAQRLGMTEKSCQVRVSHLRKRLKNHLKKEGLV